MGLLKEPRVYPANTMFNPEVQASEVFRHTKSTRELVDSSLAIKRLRSNELPPSLDESAGVPVLDDVARLCDKLGSRVVQAYRTYRNHCAVVVAIGVVSLTAVGLNASVAKSDRNIAGTPAPTIAQESSSEQSAYAKPDVPATESIAISQGAQNSAPAVNNAPTVAVNSNGTSPDVVSSVPSASGQASAIAELASTSFPNVADDRVQGSQVAERAESSQAGAAAYFRYGDSIDKRFRLGRLLTEDARRRL